MGHRASRAAGPGHLLRMLMAGLTLGLGLAPAASRADVPRYRLIDLGPGSATDINRHGVVIGVQGGADGSASSFIWSSRNGRRALDFGTPSAVARGLNDRGQVVGEGSTAWSGDGVPVDPRPIVWRASQGARTLLGSAHGQAHDINNAGIVVGGAAIDQQGWQPFAYSVSGRQLWRLALPSPMVFGSALAIDDLDRIAGTGSADLDPVYEGDFALAWASAAAPGRLLGRGFAAGIGPDGLPIGTMLPVVGVQVPRDAGWWSDGPGPCGTAGAYRPLGSLPGRWQLPEGYLIGGSANASNAAGTIVGHDDVDGTLHGFVWTAATGMVDLNDRLVPLGSSPGSFQVWSAAAINDRGWIAGTAIVDGHRHAVLLRPVPEPPAMALLGLGLLALAGRRAVGPFRRVGGRHPARGRISAAHAPSRSAGPDRRARRR